FQDLRKLLSSSKGVGPVTTSTILAALPEIGHLDRRAIGCLVGVVPLARDSGKKHGKRSCWGGRSQVGHVLYMATVSAITHNPVVCPSRPRLLTKATPPKAALFACLRKLLTIRNAMVRD